MSSAQQRAATILSFIPLFIMLAAFTGGMQIATDSTAGERERGSLEPLLVNPAPRRAIAAGKWLAATFAAMLSVLLTTALVLAMLRYIPLQELGIRFRLGPTQIGGLLAAVLPMCLLSTGVQTYLATFARSFKEAQSYMGFLIMVPMLPGMLASLYPLDSQPWMYPIPILGQHVLAADVARRQGHADLGLSCRRGCGARRARLFCCSSPRSCCSASESSSAAEPSGGLAPP